MIGARSRRLSIIHIRHKHTHDMKLTNAHNECIYIGNLPILKHKRAKQVRLIRTILTRTAPESLVARMCSEIYISSMHHAASTESETAKTLAQQEHISRTGTRRHNCKHECRLAIAEHINLDI